MRDWHAIFASPGAKRRRLRPAVALIVGMAMLDAARGLTVQEWQKRMAGK